MLTVTTDGKHGAFELNLFSSISEITSDYLNYVTKDVHVANNHILIALLCKEKITTALMTVRQNKPANTAAVPVFVKAGDVDNLFMNSLKTCDKLIIPPSDLSMGYHVNAPYNEMSFNNIMNKFEGDNIAYQRLVQQIKDDNSDGYIYFIEFKIVPAHTIKGSYRKEESDIAPVNNIIKLD